MGREAGDEEVEIEGFVEATSFGSFCGIVILGDVAGVKPPVVLVLLPPVPDCTGAKLVGLVERDLDFDEEEEEEESCG